MSDSSRHRPKFRIVHPSDPYVTSDDYPPDFIAPVPEGAEFDWGTVEEESVNETASLASKQPHDPNATEAVKPSAAPPADSGSRNGNRGEGREGENANDGVMADPDGLQRERGSHCDEGTLGNSGTQRGNDIDLELSRRVAEVNRNQLNAPFPSNSNKSPTEGNRHSPLQNKFTPNRGKKREKKKKAKKPLVSFTCDVCNLTVHSEGNYRDHMRGKVHTTKLRQMGFQNRNTSLKSALNFSPVLPPVQSDPTDLRPESSSSPHNSPVPTTNLSQTTQPSNPNPSRTPLNVQSNPGIFTDSTQKASLSQPPPSIPTPPSGETDGNSIPAKPSLQVSSTALTGSVEQMGSPTAENQSNAGAAAKKERPSTSVSLPLDSDERKIASSSEKNPQSSLPPTSPAHVDNHNAGSIQPVESKNVVPDKDSTSLKAKGLTSPLTPLWNDDLNTSAPQLLSTGVDECNVSKDDVTTANKSPMNSGNTNSPTLMDSTKTNLQSTLSPRKSDAGKTETHTNLAAVFVPSKRAGSLIPKNKEQTADSSAIQPPKISLDVSENRKETRSVIPTKFRKEESTAKPPLQGSKAAPSALESSYDVKQPDTGVSSAPPVPAPSSTSSEKPDVLENRIRPAGNSKRVSPDPSLTANDSTKSVGHQSLKSHLQPPSVSNSSRFEKSNAVESNIGKSSPPKSSAVLEGDEVSISPKALTSNKSVEPTVPSPKFSGSVVGEKRKRNEHISVDERDLIRRRRDTPDEFKNRLEESGRPTSSQKSDDLRALPDANSFSKPNQGRTRLSEADTNEEGARASTELATSKQSEADPKTMTSPKPDQIASSPASPPFLKRDVNPVNDIGVSGTRTAGLTGTEQQKSSPGNEPLVSEDPGEEATTGAVAFPSASDNRLFSGAQKIPREWLEEPMSKSEWLELRNNILRPDSTSPDVDQLAFKIMQEILLSPVRGMKFHALAPFSRALMSAVPHHYAVPHEGFFARFSDVKRVMKGPNTKFRNAAEDWMKNQSEEALSVALFEENLEFTFKTYEDRDCVQPQPKQLFPCRGTFGPRKAPDYMLKEGERSARYDDSVSNDILFNKLFDYQAGQEDHLNF